MWKIFKMFKVSKLRQKYLTKILLIFQVLKAYLKYLTEVGILLGGEENSTRQQMIDVIEFETQIANVSSV